MRHDRDEADYFLDMVAYARRAIRFVDNQPFESFIENEITRLAVYKCLEIIGEAASKISSETRTLHSDIPWGGMIGMRNILVHDYEGVADDMVYRTVIERLPELLIILHRILQANGWEDRP